MGVRGRLFNEVEDIFISNPNTGRDEKEGVVKTAGRRQDPLFFREDPEHLGPDDTDIPSGDWIIAPRDLIQTLEACNKVYMRRTGYKERIFLAPHHLCLRS